MLRGGGRTTAVTSNTIKGTEDTRNKAQIQIETRNENLWSTVPPTLCTSFAGPRNLPKGNVYLKKKFTRGIKQAIPSVKNALL